MKGRLRALLGDMFTARFLVELIVLLVFSAVMLVSVVSAVTRLFDNQNVQYFLVACYIFTAHNDLCLRIIKRLRIEKASE